MLRWGTHTMAGGAQDKVQRVTAELEECVFYISKAEGDTLGGRVDERPKGTRYYSATQKYDTWYF